METIATMPHMLKAVAPYSVESIGMSECVNDTQLYIDNMYIENIPVDYVICMTYV